MTNLFFTNILQAAISASIEELILDKSFIYDIKLNNKSNSELGTSINGWIMTVQLSWKGYEKTFFIPIDKFDGDPIYQLKWSDWKNALISAFTYFHTCVNKQMKLGNIKNISEEISFDDYQEMCN